MYVARTRGFCGGVRRALDMVNACLTRYGPPVYVLHPIVHNRFVVEDFQSRGVVFIERVAEAAPGRPLILSAHGVSKAVEEEASRLGASAVIDATCPLVKQVHRQVRDHWREGEAVILMGHRDHPEIQGTIGQVKSEDSYVVECPADIAALPGSLAQKPIVCVAQTTLTQAKVDDMFTGIRARFPKADVTLGKTVCYASTNRQQAVMELAEMTDMILVVGSKNSSNANRLRETAEAAGVPAYLIDSAGELSPEWLNDVESVGVTAGASTPEYVVERLLTVLKSRGWDSVEEVGAVEKS
ncbi:MAG: 4-hydroxy-3-methylbut-2-enyl diphosphate reductase [Lentisphaeria bacterium]|nr:4-hydroxy-3-methylbut-2-enyl diphosphate reductase [Lentisphaeria bacterium]